MEDEKVYENVKKRLSVWLTKHPIIRRRMLGGNSVAALNIIRYEDLAIRLTIDEIRKEQLKNQRC